MTIILYIWRGAALAAATIALWPAFAGATIIAENGVACRAAPLSNGYVLATLAQGETVTKLSSRAGWAYVDPAEAAACWVEARYLRENAALAAPIVNARVYHRYAARKASASRSAAIHLPKVSSSRATVRKAYHKVPAARTRATIRTAYSSYRHRSSPRMSTFSSGSCSCGSGRICVGPRGGRYCITSGGNKRYGM